MSKHVKVLTLIGFYKYNQPNLGYPPFKAKLFNYEKVKESLFNKFNSFEI
jgi:hypothetical protein